MKQGTKNGSVRACFMMKRYAFGVVLSGHVRQY